ncbi:hypothetical protein SKAU_G00374000 [Synaphobranchus kaupii]|uniref:Uncharacterized protein n=1 Tax=Synaphobranchus kaupii TaxID=118154 RepID=A0A9Q1EGM3_SYNKA|nr:hypothetical protein SKAU_G00374000 [Synaphobranchus kaupii]
MSSLQTTSRWPRALLGNCHRREKPLVTIALRVLVTVPFTPQAERLLEATLRSAALLRRDFSNVKNQSQTPDKSFSSVPPTCPHKTQRRVTFHLPDGSQESCSDSGLGDQEPSSSASTTQPLPLGFTQEEYYEQTSPNSRTEGDGNSDPESSEYCQLHCIMGAGFVWKDTLLSTLLPKPLCMYFCKSLWIRPSAKCVHVNIKRRV